MDAEWLANLNEQQRAAATFANTPLLIIAGAGTGKTNTLAHRVAHLIATGVNPARILLLTFTRRAAAEMIRRDGAILSRLGVGRGGRSVAAGRVWGGTFHAIATRLLRRFGKSIRLPADIQPTDGQPHTFNWQLMVTRKAPDGGRPSRSRAGMRTRTSFRKFWQNTE